MKKEHGKSCRRPKHTHRSHRALDGLPDAHTGTVDARVDWSFEIVAIYMRSCDKTNQKLNEELDYRNDNLGLQVGTKMWRVSEKERMNLYLSGECLA